MMEDQQEENEDEQREDQSDKSGQEKTRMVQNTFDDLQMRQEMEEVEDEEEEEEEDSELGEDDPEKNFPEYANEANKKLNQNIINIKKDIQKIDRQIEDYSERYQIMQDHFKNILNEI